MVYSAGAGKYAYDANGNTVSDGRHTFAYDALNRLVSVSVKNKVTARYTYDAWNRRTSKTAGGRTIRYHYDQDSRLIGESLANGTVLGEYVYLRGEPVALLEYETRPGWYFYVTDHLGTPQQLVDSRGAVVWQAACLPYGEAKVLKATVQNNLRFPGQYFDAETGLHYNWNRYYNPKTGRYITADPIGLAGGTNLYAYAGGNPMNAVDLEGLIIDAAIDVGFIAYDLYRILTDNIFGDEDNLEENCAALGADVGGFFVPMATGIGLGVRAVSKTESVIWKNMKPWRGKIKTNGEVGKKRKYYEWDHTHNDIEVYNSRGEHIGSMDPKTGKMTKPPVAG